MKKIPVLRTIGYGYSFTFGHLGTIIGLIWLPMVIVAVAGYFVMSQYYATFPDAMEQGNPTAVGQSALIVVVWSALSLLISSMMYAAVTRQALGLRHGGAIVNFSFGVMELRVFGAIVALLALFLLFTLAYGAAMGLAGALALLATSMVGKAASGVAIALLAVAAFLAMIYVLVRLSFLLIPATVAEEKIGLVRSWQLGKGNFWRILLVGIATLGPLLLAMGACEIAILGPDFFVPKGNAAAGIDAQMRQMMEQMRAAAPHLPVLYGFSFLIAPLLLGLSLAPPAFAYRALTGKEDGA